MNDPLRREAHEARAAIASGALRGAALVERLRAVPFADRDAWVDELLGIDAPPDDAPDLPRGSVPYLPCGIDEVIAMAQSAPVRPRDDFVDLGSGLGRVAMLVHLLTGARARGVEIQEHLVRRARERCAALGLADVTFTCANAAEVDLDGSVFFLYAPFNGAMLGSVLARLEAAARRRPVVVAAVGLELAGRPWLRARSREHLALTLYDAAW